MFYYHFCIVYFTIICVFLIYYCYSRCFFHFNSLYSDRELCTCLPVPQFIHENGIEFVTFFTLLMVFPQYTMFHSLSAFTALIWILYSSRIIYFCTYLYVFVKMFFIHKILDSVTLFTVHCCCCTADFS